MSTVNISNAIIQYELLHKNIIDTLESIEDAGENLSTYDPTNPSHLNLFSFQLQRLKTYALLLNSALDGEVDNIYGIEDIKNYLNLIYNGPSKNSYLKTYIRTISDNLPKLKGLTTDSISSNTELNYINIANIRNLANLYTEDSDTETTNADNVINYLRSIAVTVGDCLDTMRSIVNNLNVARTSSRYILSNINKIEGYIDSENYSSISIVSILAEIDMIRNTLDSNTTVTFESAASNIRSGAFDDLKSLKAIFIGDTI